MLVNAEMPIVVYRVVRRWNEWSCIRKIAKERQMAVALYVNNSLLCVVITLNTAKRPSVSFHSAPISNIR